MYLKHDGNITIYNDGICHIFELEKFYGYKGFPIEEKGGLIEEKLFKKRKIII